MHKTRIIIILLVLLISLSIVTVALGAVRSAGDDRTVVEGPKPPDDEGIKPDEGGTTAPEAGTTVPNVLPFLKAPPEGVSPAEYAIGKIDPLLRETAKSAGDETVDVYVLTGKGADLELYGTILAKSEVDELGLVHILLRVPARLLIKVASRADVAAVASIDAKPAPEPPDPEAPGSKPVAQVLTEDSISQEQAAKAQQAHTQALQVLAPELTEPPVQPEGWFENKFNGVYSTWMKGVSGRGDSANPIRYAVIDTGVDFCNTALIGRWAVQNSSVITDYNGWPIAYDDRSAVQFVSKYPGPGSGYGGNWGWYVNATRTVNGSSPFTFSDALYGTTYTVKVPSAGNVYRYGYHPDWLWHYLRSSGASPVILVTASTTPGVYDKVYIDGDWDQVFEPSDVVVQKSSPAGCVDWTGPTGPDGIADDSYGLMYWMSDGANPLPGVSWLYGSGVVPPSGEVLMFMINDLSMSGGDHGTMCASSAAGIDYHGGAFTPLFYDPTHKLASFYNGPVDGPIVQGPASGGPLNYGAGIIAIGNFYAGGSPYNDYLFTVFGYDGNAYGDYDNAHIVSLSYGSGGEDADAWDFQSEFLDVVNLFEVSNPGFHTPVWVKSAGNGGHGYGTVNTPGPTTGVAVGASTQYGPYLQWGRYEFVTNAIRAVFQDIQPWSDRGPTAMNTLAPHVSADGAWGSGAIPVNEATYSSYYGYDGAAAWTVWGGTSRSAPVAAGMMALIFDGWYQKHGTYPDWQTARDLMMNGALDLKYDEFSTGAGQADPYRSVLAGSGTYGIYVQPGFYTAGSFPPGSGTKFAAFGNGLLPGQIDTANFTVTNLTASPINVSLRDEQLQLVGTVTGTVNVLANDPDNYFYGAPNYLVDLTPFVNANPTADLMVVRVVEPFEAFDTLPPTPPSYNSRFRTMIYNVYDLNGNGIWWNDLNANGRVDISPTVAAHELDLGDEYIRFTYSYVYNVAQEMSVHDPYERKGSGGIWLGIARATGTAPTTLNYEVRFYKEQDWNNVTLNTTSLLVPAGVSVTFTATIDTSPHGATLLTENFDAAAPPALPAGWAVRSVVTDTGTLPDWFTNAGTNQPSGQPAHSAPNLAYINSHIVASPKSARLYRTTGLDLSSLSNVELSFWMYHDTGYGSTNDRVQVQVCTVNPCTGATANWVNVGSELKRYDGTNGWKKHVVNLGAFTGSGFTDVKLGFLGIGGGGNDVHIDDVEVYEVFPLAPGVYTGRVVVHDPGTGTYPAFDTVIPIDLQVFALVRGDPVLGGTARAMTPYENGYIYGATDWGGRSEAGDWRMFGLVITQTVPGSVLMVDNVWQDYPTDIDTLILDQVPGWPLSVVGDPGGPGGPLGTYPYRWFGPYTMDDLGAGSLRTYASARPNWKFYTNIAGYSGTQTHEFVTAPAYDGLRMLLHEEVVYGGHTTAVPFTTHVAVAAITPNPVDFGSGLFCTGNALNVQFKSGMNMDSLQLGGVYGWYQPQILKNQPLYQDPPADPKLSSWILPIALNGSYKLDVTTMNAVNIPDLDLYIVKDNNSNGIWDAGDVQVGVSAGATADEHVLLKGLANGTYLVVVHGYSVSGNPGFFDIVIENAQGGPVLSVTGLPTPVVAGQMYNLTVTMVEPPPMGGWKAILLFGPPGADRAIEVPVYARQQGEGDKLAWGDNYFPNELITYTINLTSAPGAPMLWTLTDPIPAGTEFVNVSGATYNGGLNRVEWSGWLGSGLAPVFYENFDTITPPALPGGWYSMTFTYTTGTLPTWLTNAGTHDPSGYPAHTPPNLVYYNSFHTSGNPGMLLYRTSGVDLSATGTAVLHFWMFHDTGYASDPDRVIVMVCANGSCTAKADWVSASAPINRYDGSIGWKEHVVDLSAFTGPGITDVRIGFLGISDYGNDIHIDDVALYAPIFVPNHQIILTLRALSSGYVTNVADINTSPVPWAVGLFTCPVQDTVYVINPSQADFSGTPTSGVAPLNVVFTNLSTGDFTSNLWKFGDGSTSTQANPAHNYTVPGVYTVTLTVSGLGGTDTMVKTSYITVYTPAHADFSATPTSGIAPLNVAFTNLSTGDFTSSLWDFGDGGTSTQASPAHNYTTGGVYTVTLTVSGLGGTDTVTKVGYITVRYGIYLPMTVRNSQGVAAVNQDMPAGKSNNLLGGNLSVTPSLIQRILMLLIGSIGMVGLLRNR